MAGRDPNEREVRRSILAAEASFAQSSAGSMLGRLQFDGPLGEVNRRIEALRSLDEAISRARARGYVWAGDLETKLQQSQSLGQNSVGTARSESARAAQSLRGKVDALVRDAARAASGDALRNESAIESVARECRSVDGAIDAAERRIAEATAQFTSAVDALDDRVKRIHWTLDQFEQSSFALQPEENPLAVVKAAWEDSPQGRSEGALFFTAHRLRFERHEEVVLERTLLVFASRTELRRTLLMDAPVGYLAASDDTERGVLMKDQLLVLTWRMATGGFAKCTFEIDEGSAKQVDTLVEQIRSGDLERERYKGALPQSSKIGVPVRWPEQCSQCGARLEPPVRGQTIITCEFCTAKHDVVLGEG